MPKKPLLLFLGFFELDFKLLRHRLLIKKNANMFDESETISPRLLITGYSYSVISCDNISIEQFLCNYCSLFVLVSSLNMWLDLLHLEYHFVECFIRLTNCLKMSVSSTSIVIHEFECVLHFLLLLNLSS